jgi:hypothetical protein
MAKKKRRTGTAKEAKKMKPRAKNKAAKTHPPKKKKAAAKKSVAKQVKAKPAAKKAAEKRASRPLAARTAFLAAAPAAVSDTLGEVAATNIALACAQVQDPDTKISDLPIDDTIFESCVAKKVKQAGFQFEGIPASASTVSDVISAIEDCPPE